MTDTAATDVNSDSSLLVGQRIRLLRDQRELTLRTLADRCGLSVNAISKIERGESSPTVASLHLLASALDVPITEFFQHHADQRVVHMRRDRRLHSRHNGTNIESLGSGLRDQQLEPFLMTLDARSGHDSHRVTHSGQEFVYCLQGCVQYEIGTESYVLEAGDSLLFEADQAHRCPNNADAPAIILLVFQTREGMQAARQQHLEA